MDLEKKRKLLGKEIILQFIGYKSIFILTSCRVRGGENPTRRGTILFMKIKDMIKRSFMLKGQSYVRLKANEDGQNIVLL